jgi:hypothetical protein
MSAEIDKAFDVWWKPQHVSQPKNLEGQPLTLMGNAFKEAFTAGWNAREAEVTALRFIIRTIKNACENDKP